MFVLNLFSSSNSQFITKLNGHTGQVISMSISENGKLLASGGTANFLVDNCHDRKGLGTDGIRIWSLQSFQEIQVPQQPYHEKGQITCTTWVTRRNEAFDTLCYGNALGWLVFLQHRPTEVRR